MQLISVAFWMKNCAATESHAVFNGNEKYSYGHAYYSTVLVWPTVVNRSLSPSTRVASDSVPTPAILDWSVIGTFEDSKLPYPRFAKNAEITVKSQVSSRGDARMTSPRATATAILRNPRSRRPRLRARHSGSTCLLLFTAEPAFRSTAETLAPADSADSSRSI
jgi:hypothetical protein